jgi:hypothetical protein
MSLAGDRILDGGDPRPPPWPGERCSVTVVGSNVDRRTARDRVAGYHEVCLVEACLVAHVELVADILERQAIEDEAIDWLERTGRRPRRNGPA